MIEDILLVCAFCLGVHAITREQSVLGVWQKIIEDSFGELRSYLFEPISECVTCMASFWGLTYYCMVGRIELLYYIIFSVSVLLMIMIHLIWEDKRQLLKYIYLCLAMFLVYQAHQPLLCIVVLVSSSGINYIIDLILARLVP